MAGFSGRSLTLDWDSTTLVGVQSKSIDFTADRVDVTTDDDNGWATFLPAPGKKSGSTEVSGITSDEVLINEYFNGSGEDVVVNLPSVLTTPGTITGSGLMTNLSLSAEHDGAYQFSATIITSGAVTYVASV